jgi:dipeptidyl aminopeptidase/acylaminoacyl peptidase
MALNFHTPVRQGVTSAYVSDPHDELQVGCYDIGFKIRMVSFMDGKRAVLSLQSFVFLFLIISATAHAAEPPPVEAFGALPQVSDVELSPNGKLLAFYEIKPRGAQVVMFDLEAHKDRQTVPVALPAKFRSITWADNETLLVTVSYVTTFGQEGVYEVYRTYAADVSGGKPRLLLMSGGDRDLVTGADMLSWRTTKPKTVIMTTWDYAITQARQQTGSRLAGGRKDSGWVSQVFEVDTVTGKGTQIEVGTQFTEDWVVDKKGTPVARSEWNPASEVFTIMARDGRRSWKEIFRQEKRGGRVMYGLTSDETAIIVSDTNDAGRRILSTLPLDGSPAKLLLEDAEHDVTGVVYDRITRAPVRAWLGGLEQSQRWLDKDAEQLYRRVAGAFRDKRVEVYGRSEDGSRVLASVESLSSPPVYYFIDFATRKADIVGEAYPALINTKLGEVRSIHYKARDGAMVPAYLTLPPQSPGTNLPLVVLPHGGPEARDTHSFNWWVQFLASRGYAVLQPQFRGSTGFGEAWRVAGYRQWGKLMQDDVTDGVQAMVEQGIAAAGRVCIAGASYGGYAALAGAAFTPDLYRCAASINGVSNLGMMLTYERKHAGEESDALAYWRDHIGPSREAKSPVDEAAKIKIPVLLMHAADDTVVPESQSQNMSRALSSVRKDVSYIKLPGEDHWLSQSVTRVQVLKELEKFLDVNLRAK